MAKIKDLVVVDKQYIIDEIESLEKSLAKNESMYLLGRVKALKRLRIYCKPLTPIISDAWSEKDTTLSDYLNDKEI